MNSSNSRNAEKRSNFEGQTRRRFWDIFLLTENGKLKSSFLVYAFSLSLLFLVFYFLAYGLLLGPIEALVKDTLPVPWINLIESVVPAVVSTASCLLFFLISRDKRLVPAAFLFLFLYALFLLIAVSLALRPEDRSDFMQLYSMFVPVPLFFGCGSSIAIYLKYRKKQNPY